MIVLTGITALAPPSKGIVDLWSAGINALLVLCAGSLNAAMIAGFGKTRSCLASFSTKRLFVAGIALFFDIGGSYSRRRAWDVETGKLASGSYKNR